MKRSVIKNFILKSISGILLVGSFSALAAEDCKTASPEQILVPAVVLNSLFATAEAYREVRLPFPPQMCPQRGQKIKVLDPFGNLVGQFIISETWRGGFTPLTSSAGQEQEIPGRYAATLEALNVHSYSATEILLGMIFDHHYSQKGESSQVTLVKGNFHPKKAYYLDEQNLDKSLQLVGLKEINYLMLIERLKKKSGIYKIFGQGEFNDPEEWRIPSTKKGPSIDLNVKNEIMPLGEFVGSLISDRYRLQKDCDKGPVVIYGPPLLSPSTINVFEWLRGAGCKNIEWFRNGEPEWSVNILTDKLLEYKHGNQIDAPELLAMGANADTLLIDMRQGHKYKAGHIPGAINVPFLDIPRPETSALKLINPRRLVFDKDLVELMKGKSRLIVYYDEVDSLIFEYARNEMRVQRTKGGFSTFIYTGGYRDWLSRRLWLGEKNGYTIETPKSAKK